jgi:hypothetical protein
LFDSVATDAYKTDLAVYLDRFETQYNTLRLPAALLILVTTISGFLRQLRISAGKFWGVLFSGILAGLTTSIRFFGLYILLLVCLYMLLASLRDSLRILPIYIIAALITTYITWPFLWDAPVQRFIEVSMEMRSFAWSGSVLFNSELIKASDLPWNYFPHMMILQFTLPVLFLLLPGVFLSVKSVLKTTAKTKTILIILLWLLPLLVIMMLPDTVFYDNFRQVLFLVPPILLTAVLGLDFVVEKIQPWIGRIVIYILIILPGIIGIIQLHPYEYTYYNELIGNIEGAYGRYETDYWCTSTREGIEFLNQNAQNNAVIGYNKGLEQVMPFARSDLTVVKSNSDGSSAEITPDYIMLCLRGGLARSDQLTADAFYKVEKSGVPFLVIKEIH